ncbi:MAG: DUF3144 domain-containing protein [Gammaproteobacteria bacterium]|nr:MAG: DUF3144 domain-containing protein [Gammaproteobacteria bacterium]
MSNNEVRDAEFWKLADEFIHLAQQQGDNSAEAKINASLLFAAARLNAFMFANSSDNLETFRHERELAIDYFSDQFRQALMENLVDYEIHFEEYRNKG